MKKTLLLIILTFGLFPLIEQGKIHIAINRTLAQSYGSEDGGGGSGGGNEAGIISSLSLVLGMEVVGLEQWMGRTVLKLADGSIFDPSSGSLDEVVIRGAAQTSFPELFPSGAGVVNYPTIEDLFNHIGQNTIPQNPDCNPAAQTANTASSNRYTADVKAKAATFDPFTPLGTNQDEQTFNVQQRPNDDTASTTPIVNLSTSGGATVYDNWTRARVHTHPHGGKPFPSATDLQSLSNAYGEFGRMTDSYIIAANGTKYNLHVSDPFKLAVFRLDNGTFADPTTHDFSSGSTLRSTYEGSYNDLIAAGYSVAEASERAYVFTLNDSGITITKAAPGSDIFKKIGLEKVKNPNGTLKKDALGNQLYAKKDCP